MCQTTRATRRLDDKKDVRCTLRGLHTSTSPPLYITQSFGLNPSAPSVTLAKRPSLRFRNRPSTGADTASPKKRSRDISEPLEDVVTPASLGATPQGRLERAQQRAQRDGPETPEAVDVKPKAKRKKRVWLKKGQGACVLCAS
jgi:hypothetical protein